MLYVPSTHMPDIIGARALGTSRVEHAVGQARVAEDARPAGPARSVQAAVRDAHGDRSEQGRDRLVGGQRRRPPQSPGVQGPQPAADRHAGPQRGASSRRASCSWAKAATPASACPPGFGGKMFRAFDKKTGAIVWEMELPAGVSNAPMTYMVNGKQFIVVAASGRHVPGRARRVGDCRNMRNTSLLAIGRRHRCPGGRRDRPEPAETAKTIPAVTSQMLENPSPEDWLMYSRTYDAQRFSPLEFINRRNVGQLEDRVDEGAGDRQSRRHPHRVSGRDVRDSAGRHRSPHSTRPTARCCGNTSATPTLASRTKTLAIYRDLVYYAAPDGFIVALDARDGQGALGRRRPTAA